jgi:hypothetical protein
MPLMFPNTCAQGHHSSLHRPLPNMLLSGAAVGGQHRSSGEVHMHGSQLQSPSVLAHSCLSVLFDARKCCRCTLLSKCWVSITEHPPSKNHAQGAQPQQA